MFRYKIAAVISIIAGISYIPLLFLAVWSGLNPGLMSVLNGLIVLISIFEIFIYSTLGRYLRSFGIVWPIIALIMLSVLSILIAIVEALFPSLEGLSLSIATTLIELILFGIARLALSIQLIRGRSRHVELAILYPFALCSLASAVLSVSVVMAPLVFITDMVSSFMLAVVFFRIAGQSDSQQQTNSRVTISRGVPFLLTVVSVVAICCLIGQFVVVYELSLYEWGELLNICTSGLMLLLTLALARLLSRRFVANSVASGLYWLAAAYAVLFGYLLIEGGLIGKVESQSSNVITSMVLNTALPALLSMVVGAAWFYLGIALGNIKDELGGYRKSLLWASLASALGYLLVFPDTLIIVGLFAFNLGAISLSFSARLPSGVALPALSPGKQKIFVVITLVLPVTAYLVYHIIVRDEVWVVAQSVSKAFLTESTAMEKVSVKSNSQAMLPPQATMLSSSPVLNDVWFIEGGGAYAVDNSHLYFREDDKSPWQPVHQLQNRGDVVRFDAEGLRGWAGTAWGSVELTEDGGNTWRTLDPDKIFKNLSALDSGEGLVDYGSKLFLDPATGHGSISINCRFFWSDDFAKTWQVQTFSDSKGKRICTADTPFVIDETSRAMISSSLLEDSDTLYRHNKKNDVWEAVCVLDETISYMRHLPFCDEAKNLSSSERDLIFYNKNVEKLLQEASIPNKVIDLIIHGKLPDKNTLNGMSRSNKERDWLVERGVLFYKFSGAKDWTIESFIPQLTHVLPINETSAVGWDNDLKVHVSVDGGRVWRPLNLMDNTSENEYANGIYPDPQRQGLWITIERELLYLPFNDLRLRRLLQTPEDDYFSLFGVSTSGDRLWVYSNRSSTLHISTDRGTTWKLLDIQTVFQDAEYELDLTNVVCSDIGPCYLFINDGSVFEVKLSSQEKVIDAHKISNLPESEYPGYGPLMTDNNGKIILFIESDSSNAYRSVDSGKHWTRVSLEVDGSWSLHERFRGQDSYIIFGSEEAILINNLVDDWVTINPSDWGDSLGACWGPGTEAMYLFDRENLTLSNDAGRSWLRNKELLDNRPFCGINNGLLWLNHDGMRIFRLGDQ